MYGTIDLQRDAHEPDDYGMPLPEESVGEAYIPLHGYAGGVSVLAQLRGDALESLVDHARKLAAVGVAASAILLIVDLGRPSRFRNMLRAFRTPSGTTAVAAALLPVLRRLSSKRKVAQIAVEHELPPRRRGPLERGGSAKLWTLAKGLTWASLLVSLPLLPKTPRRIAAVLLGTAGGLALRFAIVSAGRSSAEDTEVVLD
jgi:hypothetical protein